MFQHLGWPLRGFDTIPKLDDRPRTKYPIRYLRYWFPRMFLQKLYAEIREPLSVLEVGIEDGRMLGFMGGPTLPDGRIGLPSWIARWDGLDIRPDCPALRRCAYSDFIEADVEGLCNLRGRRYHAIVLIHVLEHLSMPELAMVSLRDALHSKGAIIGGSPTMPDLIALIHEPWLRRKHRAIMDDPRSHRHLSVITPGRIKRFARRNDLTTEYLAGTFFVRSSGFVLENYRWWARLNLLWGAAFPALGAEVYFSLRTT
jgi:hypothetical protein